MRGPSVSPCFKRTVKTVCRHPPKAKTSLEPGAIHGLRVNAQLCTPRLILRHGLPWDSVASASIKVTTAHNMRPYLLVYTYLHIYNIYVYNKCILTLGEYINCFLCSLGDVFISDGKRHFQF